MLFKGISDKFDSEFIVYFYFSSKPNIATYHFKGVCNDGKRKNS